MHRATLTSLVTWVACTTVAAADYFNYTFGNEWYLRAGYEPLIYQPYSTQYAELNYTGIDDFLFANYYGISPVSQPIYDGCDGLCAASFPFGLQFNTSQAPRSVHLNPISAKPDALDLYSFKYGCVAFGPNGTDHKGHKTYGRVPRDCTISLTAKNGRGKTLKHDLSFKAHGNPSNLTYGALPTSWRNLTAVYWNATSKPSKSFPHPVVVAFDDLAYGVQSP